MDPHRQADSCQSKVHMTIPVAEAAAALCQHVQKQLQCNLFSDITVCFQGKDYRLHKIILSQSSYFRSLLSGPWKEAGKPRVELQIDDVHVTPQGLETAFAYMYGIPPIFSDQSVMSVLAAGCFLCLENLCDRCVEYMVQDLREDTFLRYQHLSEQNCYGRFADRIRDACWTFLCTHASCELTHVLPKLSLQLLCQLLRSDELWVLNEMERYKLAKQALTEWKLARLRSTNRSSEFSTPRRTRTKMNSSTRKSVRTMDNTKSKAVHKNGKQSFKHKNNKKRDIVLSSVDEKDLTLPLVEEDSSETGLKKLRRLWESDNTEQSDGLWEDFSAVNDIFTRGGIIYAHMEANEVLQVRTELEDADMSTDAANDGIWQYVLLKSCVLNVCKDSDVSSSLSTDDDSDSDMDASDTDSSDDMESSESDSSSMDHSGPEDEDEEDAVPEPGNEIPSSIDALKRTKSRSTIVVGFSIPGGTSQASKRRASTGGFSWAAKPDVGMQLIDFPPFRFGAEFILKDKKCVNASESKELFYGGSMWKLAVLYDGGKWLFFVQCRQLKGKDSHSYEDKRKKVVYMAHLYISTRSGLRCVAGTGERATFKHGVSIRLSQKELFTDKPLRVCAVVQLIGS